MPDTLPPDPVLSDPALSDPVLSALHGVLGDAGLVTEAADTAAFAVDWRGLRPGVARAVLRPGTTQDVAACVRICAAAGVGVVPQGGNTSLVAGATPDPTGTQVVLSLQRMRAIRAIDADGMALTVDAGTTLRAAQDAAREAGCRLPLSISSEGSATVGGVLASNAGGNMTIRFGNARDLCLGIEVVMPDGAVLDALRTLRKDNSGYALRHLFLGSEGTLGIITAAVLKLAPRPAGREVALCAVPTADAVSALYRFAAARAGASLEAFEYMSRAGVELVLRHIPGAMMPFGPSPHYALLECAQADLAVEALPPILEAALAAGLITDAASAMSEAQAAALWRMRESHAEAQKREGASIKHDVSVPVAAVPAFIAEATEAVLALVPGCRPVPFGHAGDGNVHFNVCAPPGQDAAFLRRADEVTHAVNEVVRACGGSFSAEHGVGWLKTALLADWRGGPEYQTMRTIKRALDPLGIMNPGKVFA